MTLLIFEAECLLEEARGSVDGLAINPVYNTDSEDILDILVFISE
jgi:hypothetical protein